MLIALFDSQYILEHQDFNTVLPICNVERIGTVGDENMLVIFLRQLIRVKLCVVPIGISSKGIDELRGVRRRAGLLKLVQPYALFSNSQQNFTVTKPSVYTHNFGCEAFVYTVKENPGLPDFRRLVSQNDPGAFSTFVRCVAGRSTTRNAKDRKE